MSDADATRARHDVAAEVDEILEHVINANMLSMPYDVYSELFDAVDGLGVKIENLQSENAKLREYITRLEQANIVLDSDNCDLRNDMRDMQFFIAENRRLRELARDLYACGDSCTHCRHWNQGDGFYCDLGVGWKARRMRELGVEVTQ